MVVADSRMIRFSAASDKACLSGRAASLLAKALRKGNA